MGQTSRLIGCDLESVFGTLCSGGQRPGDDARVLAACVENVGGTGSADGRDCPRMSIALQVSFDLKESEKKTQLLYGMNIFLYSLLFTFPVAYEYRLTPPLLVPSAMNSDFSARSSDFLALLPFPYNNHSNYLQTIQLNKSSIFRWPFVTCPSGKPFAVWLVVSSHVKHVQGALRCRLGM